MSSESSVTCGDGEETESTIARGCMGSLGLGACCADASAIAVVVKSSATFIARESFIR